MEYPETPNLNKRINNTDYIFIIKQFLYFFFEKDLNIHDLEQKDIDNLIDEFFEIDTEGADKEHEKVYQYLKKHPIKIKTVRVKK